MRSQPSPGSLAAPWLLGLVVTSACGGDAVEDAVRIPPTAISAPAAASPGDAAAALEALGRGRHLFLSVRDEPAAAEALRRAVELDPGLVEAHAMLGKTLLSLSAVWFGTKTLDRERLAEALVPLRRAYELSPGDAEAAYWLGYALVLGEDLEGGRARLDEAVALDPDHARAHKELGLLYAGEGRGEEAKRHLVRAHELLPKDAEVLFAYGLELEADGNLERALEILEQSATLHPSLPAVYARMLVIHQRLGNEAGAAQAKADWEHWRGFARGMNAARERLRKEPDDPRSLFELGRRLAEAGMNEQAIVWLRRANRKDPADGEISAALAAVRARIELGDSTLEDTATGGGE